MKKFLTLLFFTYSICIFGQEHHSDTSIAINKKVFKIQTREINSEQVILVIYRNDKIISTDTVDSNGLSNLTFPDFNIDGYTDIMLTHTGNNFTYDLYLFDKTVNAFKFVKDFDKYPDAQQLKSNHKFYFSYFRAGCADMNWISDIFYIKNFKAIQIGRMFGNGCDVDTKEEPQTIEVYKISANTEDKEKLISKLPYLKNIPSINTKWDFIKRYWENNYIKVVSTSTKR